MSPASPTLPVSRAGGLLLASIGLLGLSPAADRGGTISLAGQERPATDVRVYRVLSESRFEVRTETAGLLAGLVDVHVVRAGEFEGTVRYDPDDVEASSVELTVPVNGLRVETSVDPDDREEIRETMLTEVLRAAEHPTIAFRSTGVRAVGDSFRVEGGLTLAGATRPVTVTLAYRSAVGRLWVWGRFSVRQTDFGIEPYSAALGTMKVADEVTFYVDAVAAPEGDPASDR